MTLTPHDEESNFEAEVIRIARQLWKTAEFGGSQIEDGRERDGVFVGEDTVNLVECTVSRRKDKAEKDVGKLIDLSEKFRKTHPDKGIKAWFITRDEPTADQRSVAQATQSRVIAVSFDQFRSRLIDARSYIDARGHYAFGSIRDPETGSTTDRTEYIPLDLLARESGAPRTIKDIAKKVTTGSRFVLLGDYGAGKSTSLREIFFSVVSLFNNNKCRAFPVHLNLRDHQGQTNPAEALLRHGTNIGMPNPLHLVRAWRAGYVVVLLDGFDEIVTAGWVGRSKKLKEWRHRSVQLIREFVKSTPPDIGLVVSGREHFFDSTKELTGALSTGEGFEILTLNEFSDDQIKAFLAKKGWSGPVPEWLPSRPLLLGYLAAKGLLQKTLEVDAGSSPAAGWHALLDRICTREAEIEAGLDGETIRRIIEQIATIARRATDGLGPLGSQDIVSAFSEVCGYPPDEMATVLLQRLPGLGVHSAGDESRAFIDRDFAAAARAGDIFRYIEDPYSHSLRDPQSWQCPFDELSTQVTALRISGAQIDPKKISIATQRAAESAGWDIAALDLIRTGYEVGAPRLSGKMYITEAFVSSFELHEEETVWTGIEFQDCIFGRLTVPPETDLEACPRFVRCHFGIVDGLNEKDGLPEGIFENCTCDAFEQKVHTTVGLLNLSIPLGSRVLLTILKKLYMQRGTGRKESALYRGLDHRARRLVPDILSLLVSEGLVVKARGGEQVVWLPERSHSGHIRRILASPETTTDPLVLKAGQIV
nr:NACHT domain-containing protein [Corallococcus coralloides]